MLAFVMGGKEWGYWEKKGSHGRQASTTGTWGCLTSNLHGLRLHGDEFPSLVEKGASVPVGKAL